MGLTQKEVAYELNYSTWTVRNWEKSRVQPSIESIPAIVSFLGYDPFPAPVTLPQHLMASRRENGWTIKNAARAAGVDPGTWGNWERGEAILSQKHHTMVTQLLGISLETLVC